MPNYPIQTRRGSEYAVVPTRVRLAVGRIYRIRYDKGLPMFHKTATAAVTGLLAVAATLTVAAGAANAADRPGSSDSPGGTGLTERFVPGQNGQDAIDDGGKGDSGKGKGGKGGKGKGKGKGEESAADQEVAGAFNAMLRDFLRPPNGGAEMGPGGKTSDEWLDLFLGPRPGKDGGTKAEPIR